MPQYNEIHNMYTIAVFFVLCSIASYSLTEVVKPLFKIYVVKQDLRIFLIRMFACIIGAIAGYTLSHTITGFWIGLSSGPTNAFVVDTIKRYITNKTER